MMTAFVALPIPPEVRSRLTVVQFLLPLPRRVDPADFHLTLVYLGAVPDAVLTALDDHLTALRVAPFSLALSGLGLFGGAAPRAVWAGVAASAPLLALQAKVEHAARRAGARPEARRFLPHVTLGRFPPPPGEDALRLERAVVAELGFCAGPWDVDRIALMESSSARPKAPRYRVLAEYPLR